MAGRKWLRPLDAAGFSGTKDDTSRLTLSSAGTVIIINPRGYAARARERGRERATRDLTLTL